MEGDYYRNRKSASHQATALFFNQVANVIINRIHFNTFGTVRVDGPVNGGFIRGRAYKRQFMVCGRKKKQIKQTFTGK